MAEPRWIENALIADCRICADRKRPGALYDERIGRLRCVQRVDVHPLGASLAYRTVQSALGRKAMTTHTHKEAAMVPQSIIEKQAKVVEKLQDKALENGGVDADSVNTLGTAVRDLCGLVDSDTRARSLNS